jgi:GWxTD domain-containing protein
MKLTAFYLFIAISASSAFSETLILRDGSALRATAVESNGDSLRVTTAFGTISIHQDQVLHTESPGSRTDQSAAKPVVLHESFDADWDSVTARVIQELTGEAMATAYRQMERPEKAVFLDDYWQKQSRLVSKYLIGYHFGRRRFSVSDAFFERGGMIQRRYVTGFPEMHEGAIQSALDIVAQYLRALPKDPVVHCAVGYLFLEQDNVDEARDHFIKAIKTDKKLIEARNGRALAVFRMHRQKARAMKLFRETIAMDRTYAGALYAMGMCHIAMMGQDRVGLDEYFGRLVEAFPEHHDGWFKLGAFYESLRFSDRAAEAFSRQLTVNPTHKRASKGLARVSIQLKSQGKEHLTHADLDRLSQENPVHYLPLLGESFIDGGDHTSAEAAFDRYLSLIPAEERQYFSDLSLIAPPDVTRDIDDAPNRLDRNRLIRKFWTLQDPTPTTKVNERRIEHYRRVAHARANFSDGVDKLSLLGWDRRGDLYIRFGPPDHRSWSDFLVFETDPRVAKVKNRINAMAHDALVEVLPPRDLLASLNGGIAAGTIDIRGIPTFPLPRRTTQFSDGVETGYKWACWIYGSVGGGFEVTFIDDIGKGFYEFASPPAGSRNPGLWAQMSPATVVGRIVNKNPSIYNHDYGGEPIGLFVSSAGFRGDGRNTDFEVYVGIPAEYLEKNPDGTAEIQRDVSFYDEDWKPFHRSSTTLSPDLSTASSEDMIIDQIDQALPPGDYYVAVQIRDTQSQGIQIFKDQVTVRPFRSSSLQISDIEFAGSIAEATRPSPFNKGNLFVLPLPTGRIDKSAQLYFEVYNLVRDDFGRTRYRIDYETEEENVGFIARVGQLLKRSPRETGATVSYEHAGTEMDEPIHITLTLPDGAKTETITVRVTDLVAPDRPSTEQTIQVATTSG